MRSVRIDGVLQRIGGFGRWQRLQLALLAPTGLFVCWLNLVYVFIAYNNFGTDCDANRTNNASSVLWTVNRSKLGIAGNRSIHYITGDSSITFTTTVQWQLVCSRKWLRAMQQVCYAVGASLGLATFYYASNRFGRKRPLLLSTLILAITGSVAPYSHFHNLFCTLRFITGFFTGGVRICSLLLSLETSNSRYHPWILAVWDGVHAVGYMLLTSFASISIDWRTIYVTCAAPVCILLTYAFLIPESPRFLLMIRRKADAERILRKIASTNGHILRHEAVQNLSLSEREVVVANSYTFRHVVKDCRMCLWLIELLACWFLAFAAYYSFCFSIPYIGDHYGAHLLFELHTWAGFVELPAIAVVFVLATYAPRRKICLYAVAICAISSALTGVFHPKALYIPMANSAILAKLALVIYTSTLQLLTLEMFPKEIRFLMIAMTSTVANASIAVAAIIAITADVLPFLPFVFCAVAALAILGLTILLPETFQICLHEEDQEERISTIRTVADPVAPGGGTSVEMMDLRTRQSMSELEKEGGD